MRPAGRPARAVRAVRAGGRAGGRAGAFWCTFWRRFCVSVSGLAYIFVDALGGAAHPHDCWVMLNRHLCLCINKHAHLHGSVHLGSRVIP